MSDEPTARFDPLAQRERTPIVGHVCEHAGCSKDAGWGFQRSKTSEQHWFCSEHRRDGENFLDPSVRREY